ncbi:hypothetical protein FOCC_FOCC007189 [Frankliniella occidentalis]|uniref:Uncharacterized protein LOC113210699 n=1 Tax=Frankliniella occidentalis TaxID=133901 RepID=A0A6J1SUP4_FRAOC|nr:uncharacterized protein LOC113210699 [Frankliniella occidentalis]KAE8746066.1 hypothetical protein FOCC_FOCC007189 [Frankliniella occidentalis]
MNVLCSESMKIEEEVSDDSGTAAVHSLPTELLVLIFSWLSVEDLALNVSKVCQRWKDSLYFRTLWCDKELIYENSREDLFIFVLSVAPALKQLSLNPLFCGDPAAIVNAICKGPKDIRKVHYNLSLFPAAVASRILGHYKKYVCELHLEGYANKHSSIYRNLDAELGQMSQLRSLKLSGYFDTKWDKKVLERGCLNLHHLDVSLIQDESDSYKPFLDNVKSHLKTLKLPQFKSNVGVLELVSSCTELKEITLCLDDLRCISTLQSLESLHIRWSDGVLKSKMNRFVRDCPVFGNLKELTLFYIPGLLATAIAKQCNKLETLNLHGITSCANIIKSVPSLQKLCIVDRLSLRMRHIQKLPRYIPNLRHLNVLGSFLNKGIPPKIISQLKQELPELVISSEPFVRYTKRGNKGYFTKCTDSSTDCSSDEA